MTATVNGVRLSYSDIGHGIPLVCLHGGMGVDAGSLHVPGILDLTQLGIRLIIRTHMEWLAAHLPQATLCTLDGAGHFPFIEAAQRFHQCVASFIQEHDEEHLPAR